MKRIGIDVSVLATENMTGIGVYCFNLIDNLLKINNTDHFILFAITSLNSLNKNINYFKKYPNVEIKIIRLPIQLFYRLFLLWQKLEWPPIETFVGKVDIFHSFNWYFPPQKYGKRVTSFYDLSSVLYPNWHLKETTKMDKLRFKRMAEKADLNLTISESARKDFIKKYGEKRVEVIYPASNLRDKSNKGNKKDRREYFLFVGTVEPRKNLEGVIRAFSILAPRLVAKNRSTKSSQTSSLSSTLTCENFVDKTFTQNFQHFLANSGFGAFYLIIAGSKGWKSDEIYDLPKKLGIEDRVKFLDYVSDKELMKLYKNAFCLLYPSFYEGFGIPILEAQACGCPVITSNISSMPEVAGKGAILVNPYSVDDILRGIREVRGIRGKLIKVGRENIKIFSWEKSAKKLNGLYQKL